MQRHVSTSGTQRKLPRKGGKSERGSHVRAGPRRVLVAWLRTGRIFSLGVFLAAIGMLIFFFTSPRFYVWQMDVAGNNALKSEIISDLSQLRGTPIWFVDTDAAAERLLQNAYIERVSINVALPDHATITVVERKPEVRWQLGSSQFLVDNHGTVLDVAQEMPEPGTLVIVDTTLHTLQPKDRVDADALQLAQVLALRLPGELNFTPAQIGWDLGLGVFVTSSSNQTIIFGQSDNLDRKLAILNFLLTDGTAFTYLDLRPSNPFYQNTGVGN